jgi:hypothetical protein
MLATALCCLVLLSLFTLGAAHPAIDPTRAIFSNRVSRHPIQRSCILLGVSPEICLGPVVAFPLGEKDLNPLVHRTATSRREGVAAGGIDIFHHCAYRTVLGLTAVQPTWRLAFLFRPRRDPSVISGVLLETASKFNHVLRFGRRSCAGS